MDQSSSNLAFVTAYHDPGIKIRKFIKIIVYLKFIRMYLQITNHSHASFFFFLSLSKLSLKI
jgi:hypothetical protein